MIELRVGQRMRDRVSGFTGVADGKVEFLTGNVQFNLRPPVGKDGKEVEGVSLDRHQLEFVANVVEPVAPPNDTGIVLGEKVKDIVTGMEGIATLKTTFLNGCVYYTIATPDLKGSPSATFFVEYSRLVKSGDGVVSAIAKRLKTLAPAEKTTGGPSYRIPQRG